MENEAGAQGSQEQQFIQGAMQDPSVIKRVQGLDPKAQADIMRQLYQDYIGQGAANSEAMSQADALRNGATPQGVTVGNQFIASNPLSHIAKGINDYRGNRDYNKARDAQNALSQDRTNALSSVAGMKAGLPQTQDISDTVARLNLLRQRA